jgi:septal ring factor EnvC (AmiA/AmiB activator)
MQEVPAKKSQDIVGQCCHTMQILSDSVSALVDERDRMKAELQSMRLSHRQAKRFVFGLALYSGSETSRDRGDLLNNETELEVLKENFRRQQKEMESLQDTNKVLRTQLSQAEEAKTALEQHAQNLLTRNLDLEASKIGMQQVCLLTAANVPMAEWLQLMVTAMHLMPNSPI